MASTLVLLCVGFGLAAAWSAKSYEPEDAEHYFEYFIQKYGRKYASEYEKQVRFNIFKEHLEKINHLNQNSKNDVFGITQFLDLSLEELNNFHKGLNRVPGSRSGEGSCKYITDADIHDNDAPESFDWRDQNGVTPVKNQGGCGSCYAFSTIGNIESQYAIKHKQLVDISEQQIVDCDKINHGCNGGLMNVAFRSLIERGGVESEADYPYKEISSDCRFDANKVKVMLTDCRSYNLTSQEKLKQLLYHNGPLSIGIKSDTLIYYHKGIISDEDCDSGELDHAVLLVGYGSENGTPFWVVKNSWGEEFGEKGFFRMYRGENALSCGMMNNYMASSIIA